MKICWDGYRLRQVKDSAGIRVASHRLLSSPFSGCRPHRVMSSGALSEAQASTGRQSVEEDPEAHSNLYRLSQVNSAGQSTWNLDLQLLVQVSGLMHLLFQVKHLVVRGA